MKKLVTIIATFLVLACNKPQRDETKEFAEITDGTEEEIARVTKVAAESNPKVKWVETRRLDGGNRLKIITHTGPQPTAVPDK
jgi:hypothetical protein